MKKLGTLVGCAIGDALGNPFEMKLASYEPLQQWDGQFKAGGTFWKGEAGQYTDDTLMSICLAKSLIQSNGFDPEDIAKEYCIWYKSGNTRGIGNTTAEACHNLKIGTHWTESGLKNTNQAGNGTVMRVSPIGLVFRNDFNKLFDYAMQDASITHNSIEPKVGSMVIALATALLANGTHSNKDVLNEVASIISDIDCDINKKLQEVNYCLKSDLTPEEALTSIGSSGYVAHTVGTAFYCLAKAESFKDCVIMAIKCGGDTDSSAAVAGALAGTYYGLDAIPEDYTSVENYNLLNDLTEELLNI
jgi:ADP-ribosyl-[dinitrogen reductase] hydrolase